MSKRTKITASLSPSGSPSGSPLGSLGSSSGWPIAASLAAALALAAAPGAQPEAGPTPAVPRLIVHEWGTFTAVQGSDAVTLEGIAHEEEALPHFVYSRTRDGGWPEYLMKMETPVTYFYAPAPLTVDVAVDFPSGLLTQWFPDATSVAPPLPPDRRQRKDYEGRPSAADAPLTSPQLGAHGGRLEWRKLQVLAPGAPPERRFLFHAPLADSTWSHARETDSNLVRTAASREVEKFLFYRGLGKLPAPLQVHGQGHDRLTLSTGARHGATAILLLAVTESRAGFAFAGDLQPGADLQARWPEATTPLDLAVRDVGLALAERLVAAGLYPKEAQAMVATWSRQYFRTPGRRVLWILDQALTDALIPLHVTPRPDACVRVMVGRLDVLTPEQERQMVAWAEDLAAGEGRADALGHADTERTARARRAFLELGRFAECALRRTEALVADRQHVRRAVQRLLHEVATLR